MTLSKFTLFSLVYTSCCEICIAWKENEANQWMKSLGGFWSLHDLNSRFGKCYGLIWEINESCTGEYQLLVVFLDHDSQCS